MSELLDRKALRVVVGALLSADFSERELRSVGDLFARDASFGHRIADALKRFSSPAAVPKTKSEADERATPSEVAEALTATLQRQGVSRPRLLEAFARLGLPTHTLGVQTQRSSTARLVQWFLNRASAEQVSALLGLVGESGKRDPYLAGISEK